MFVNDDDVTESSIFDLDHAPEPRNNVAATAVSMSSDWMMLQPHVPPPPPPPPPSSSSVTTVPVHNRLRRNSSTSLSPRPLSSSGGIRSRKSIVIPMGDHHHLISLPPTTAPPSSTTTTSHNHTSGSGSVVGTKTATYDNHTTLSGSYLLAPITASFNRRRLASYPSSIVSTVGGNTMYGQHSSVVSPYSISAMPPNATTGGSSNNYHHLSHSAAVSRTTSFTHGGTAANNSNNSRQRSHSSTAVFSDATTPTNNTVSPHLSHVRSFPPPRGSSDDARITARHSSPYWNRSVPNLRIEETKEPIDSNGGGADDSDSLLLTDTDYESDIVVHFPHRADTMNSETGLLSVESGQPNAPQLQQTPTNDNESTLFGPDSKLNHSYNDNNDEDFDNNPGYTGDDSMSQTNNDYYTTTIQPAVLFGCIPLPRCFSKRRISWYRIASFVAIWSPCFICCRMEYSTYRAVLFRLNIICGVMAVVQLAASSGHLILLHSRTIVDRFLPTVTSLEVKNENDNRIEVITNVWNLNGPAILLGVVALGVVIAVVSTIRVIRTVNLTGAIRYYWLLLWIMPLQTFWMVSMFDYFHVTEVWIKFWWRDRTMAWYRYRFCDPTESYNRECSVPEFANVDNETAWCQINYNSTACASIRNHAQENTAKFLYYFYLGIAVWTILFTTMLFLVVRTLESIITRPLVAKSRESSIPSWLMLPTAGCIVCGLLYTYSPSSILNIRYGSVSHLQWIAPIFMIAGAMFFILALLAWLLWTCPVTQTSHKRHKLFGISLFIFIAFLLILTMATIFVSCIVESLFLPSYNIISDAIRGQIACSIDQSGSCTLCPDDSEFWNATISSSVPSTEDICPEWSSDDVTRILQSQAKAGAILAIICMLYAIGSFRYGLTVRKHIINYKIAYV